jgi:hypothetical protein
MMIKDVKYEKNWRNACYSIIALDVVGKKDV